MTPMMTVKFADGTAVGASQLTAREKSNQGGAVKLTADYEKRIVIVERPDYGIVAERLVHVPFEAVLKLVPLPVKVATPAPAKKAAA